MKRQADRPCEKCGSMYRVDDKCNVCGHVQPVPEEFYREPHELKGRIDDV